MPVIILKPGGIIMAKGKFIKEFKDFISKGNVVDMAVGVVVGGAFGKIVTGLVNYIINPCIGLLTGGVGLDGLKTVIKEAVITDGVETAPEVAILWGAWIQTIIDFIIVALCIFLVIKIISSAKAKAEERKKKEPAPEPPAPTTKICPFCCTEIAIGACRCPNCTSELPKEE